MTISRFEPQCEDSRFSKTFGLLVNSGRLVCTSSDVIFLSICYVEYQCSSPFDTVAYRRGWCDGPGHGRIKGGLTEFLRWGPGTRGGPA